MDVLARGRVTSSIRDTRFSHNYQTEYPVRGYLTGRVENARVFQGSTPSVAVVAGSAGIPVATFRQRHCSRPPDFNKFT
ncbi:hypothetical protein [Streptomyces murinus]|uniref:hypothetical protein n=1 Tax=Streptomyces murinus TaxID=33900 RepID=UPI00372ACEDE